MIADHLFLHVVYKQGYLLKTILLLLSTGLLLSCTVSKNPLRKEARRLQKGMSTEDTSHIYALPYEEGKSYRMIQGYFSRFTHQERAAIDFKMKRGTKIAAARGGVVTQVKKDGSKGRLNRKYRNEGNYIIIQHADNSRAGYWHLQKDGAFVNIGDTVVQGQIIGLSGKTGYTATPHLHFLVWGSRSGRWQSIPTRFETRKGAAYLKWWRKYKKPQQQPE